MLKYIIKRLFYFVPTFFIISLITFYLGYIAPGDPVEMKMNSSMKGEGGGENGQSTRQAGERTYLEIAEKLGRNLPPFYFSVTSSAYPDTLYKIYRKNQRENLERLIDKYGNWDAVNNYYQTVRSFDNAVLGVSAPEGDSISFMKLNEIRDNYNALYRNYETSEITANLSNIQNSLTHFIALAKTDTTGRAPKYALMNTQFEGVQTAFKSLSGSVNKSANYIPRIHWYGTANQYHRWLFGDKPWFGTANDPTKTFGGFFRGEFGDSYIDGRPVLSILQDAIKWTLLMNFIVLLVIYLIGIPIGVMLAIKQGTTFDRVTTVILFMLYSLPSFWIGTMLIIYFTNDYYASWMNLFPPYGLGKIGPEFGLWERVVDRAYHLFLPLLCGVLGSFAYISRQMRGGMLSVLRQDYIRTAFAKGLDPNKVYWKHAFRNSLIPIITIFAGLLPAMISGFLILEFLFSIPGMGRVSYEAVVSRNYPVLFTVLMFAAILTMLGTLVSDILYAVVDPRISFTKKAS